MSGKHEPEPKTKQRKSSRKKILFLLLLTPLFILTGLAILGMIVSGGDPTKADSKKTVQQPQNQPPATSTQQSHIGQTVSDAGFNFVVNSIKCGETRIRTTGLAYYYSDAQGQYCRLNVTITNTGNTANSINAYNQYVFNGQGQRYEYASDATSNAANYYVGTPLNDDINPGNSVTGDIVYDVPVSVTPITAELHGDSDSLGVRVSLQ